MQRASSKACLTSPIALFEAGSYQAHLRHFSVLVVKGQDAPNFLQGQITTDIRELTPQKAQFSATCTAQGRMIANFLLGQKEALYFLIVQKNISQCLKKTFEKYILRADVSIEESKDVLLSFSNQKMIEFCGKVEPTAQSLEVRQFKDTRAIFLPSGNWMVVLPQDQALTIQSKGHFVDEKRWQLTQIQAGIAWIGQETTEAFIPQMAGMDRMRGISFKKGCYKGQEVIARARYLGQVKRGLYHIHSQLPLKSGNILRQDDNIVGQIINSVVFKGRCEALAVIQKEAWGNKNEIPLPSNTLTQLQAF